MGLIKFRFSNDGRTTLALWLQHVQDGGIVPLQVVADCWLADVPVTVGDPDRELN